MRRSATFVLAGLAAVSGACSTPLTREQIAVLDYGPRPENYEQIVRDYLRPRLIEPPFARVDLKTEPRAAYQKDALFRERAYGWAVCAMITDKDRRGAYQQPYPMVFYIREGKVVAANGGGLEQAAGVNYAESQCKALGYDLL